jgi:hypothetical protein
MIGFADIKAYLTAIANKANNSIENSPHGAFWDTDYTTFTTGIVPGVGVPIMDRTDPLKSPFFVILTDTNGFNGLSQMPEGGPFITDTGYSVTLGDGTTPTGQQLISNLRAWLTNGFPK